MFIGRKGEREERRKEREEREEGGFEVSPVR